LRARSLQIIRQPPDDLQAFCEELTETGCCKLFSAKIAAELSGVAGKFCGHSLHCSQIAKDL
jgi:hypothetical protein